MHGRDTACVQRAIFGDSLGRIFAHGHCTQMAPQSYLAHLVVGSSQEQCLNNPVYTFQSGACVPIQDLFPRVERSTYLQVTCTTLDIAVSRMKKFEEITAALPLQSGSGVVPSPLAADLFQPLPADDGKVASQFTYLSAGNLKTSSSAHTGRVVSLLDAAAFDGDYDAGRLVFQLTNELTRLDGVDTGYHFPTIHAVETKFGSLFDALPMNALVHDNPTATTSQTLSAVTPMNADYPLGRIYNGFNTSSSRVGNEAGPGADRYFDIAGTAFDIGAQLQATSLLGLVDARYTVSLWMKATSGSQGFAFATADVFEDSEKQSSHILEKLMRIVDNGEPEEKYFPVDYHMYNSLYVDGPGNALHFIYADPISKKLTKLGKNEDDSNSQAANVMDLEWDLEQIGVTRVFNGQWHHVAIVFRIENGGLRALLAVDGETSYSAEGWAKCVDRLPTPVRSFTANHSYPVYDATRDRVIDGGVLYTGYFNGGVYGLQFEAGEVVSDEFSARGTRAMRIHNAFRKESTEILGIFMICAGITAFVFMVVTSGAEIIAYRSKVERGEEKASMIAYLTIYAEPLHEPLPANIVEVEEEVTMLEDLEDKEDDYVADDLVDAEPVQTKKATNQPVYGVLKYTTAKRWLGVSNVQFGEFLHEIKQNSNTGLPIELLAALYHIRKKSPFGKAHPELFSDDSEIDIGTTTVPTAEAWRKLIEVDGEEHLDGTRFYFFKNSPEVDPIGAAFMIGSNNALVGAVDERILAMFQDPNSSTATAAAGGVQAAADAATPHYARLRGLDQQRARETAAASASAASKKDAEEGAANEATKIKGTDDARLPEAIMQLVMPIIGVFQVIHVWSTTFKMPEKYHNNFAETSSALSLDFTALFQGMDALVTPLLQLSIGVGVCITLAYFILLDNQKFLWNLAMYVLKRDTVDDKNAPQNNTSSSDASKKIAGGTAPHRAPGASTKHDELAVVDIDDDIRGTSSADHPAPKNKGGSAATTTSFRGVGPTSSTSGARGRSTTTSRFMQSTASSVRASTQSVPATKLRSGTRSSSTAALRGGKKPISGGTRAKSVPSKKAVSVVAKKVDKFKDKSTDVLFGKYYGKSRVEVLRTVDHPYGHHVPCKYEYQLSLLPVAQANTVDTFLGVTAEVARDKAERLAKERQLRGRLLKEGAKDEKEVKDVSLHPANRKTLRIEDTDFRPFILTKPEDFRKGDKNTQLAVKPLIVKDAKKTMSFLERVGVTCQHHTDRILGPQQQTKVFPFIHPPTCCVWVNHRRCGVSQGKMYTCGAETINEDTGAKTVCSYAVCQRHFRPSLAQRVFSQLAGLLRRVRERGPGWVAAAAFLSLADACYMPFSKTALMILGCHPYYKCEFENCWANPDQKFILAAYLCIIMMLIFGLGVPISQYLALQKRKEALERIFLAKEYGDAYVQESDEEDELDAAAEKKMVEEAKKQAKKEEAERKKTSKKKGATATKPGGWSGSSSLAKSGRSRSVVVSEAPSKDDPQKEEKHDGSAAASLAPIATNTEQNTSGSHNDNVEQQLDSSSNLGSFSVRHKATMKVFRKSDPVAKLLPEEDLFALYVRKWVVVKVAQLIHFIESKLADYRRRREEEQQRIADEQQAASTILDGDETSVNVLDSTAVLDLGDEVSLEWTVRTGALPPTATPSDVQLAATTSSAADATDDNPLLSATTKSDGGGASGSRRNSNATTPQPISGTTPPPGQTDEEAAAADAAAAEAEKQKKEAEEEELKQKTAEELKALLPLAALEAMESATVQEEKEVSVAEWVRYLATDPTAFAMMYNQLEFRWLYLPPILVIFKIIHIAPAVFLEPHSFDQRLGISIVELGFTMFIFWTAPFLSPVVDVMYRLGCVHQLLLLGLHNLNVVRKYQNQPDVEEHMVTLTFLYIVGCFTAIAWIALAPIVVSQLELRGTKKKLEALGQHYSKATSLYLTPAKDGCVLVDDKHPAPVRKLKRRRVLRRVKRIAADEEGSGDEDGGPSRITADDDDFEVEDVGVMEDLAYEEEDVRKDVSKAEQTARKALSQKRQRAFNPLRAKLSRFIRDEKEKLPKTEAVARKTIETAAASDWRQLLQEAKTSKASLGGGGAVDVLNRTTSTTAPGGDSAAARVARQQQMEDEARARREAGTGAPSGSMTAAAGKLVGGDSATTSANVSHQSVQGLSEEEVYDDLLRRGGEYEKKAAADLEASQQTLSASDFQLAQSKFESKKEERQRASERVAKRRQERGGMHVEEMQLQEVLQGLSTDTLREIRQYQKPPRICLRALEAVAMLVTPDLIGPNMAPPQWKDIKKLVGQPDFFTILVKFNAEQVEPRVVELLFNDYLGDDDFTHEKAEKTSQAIVPVLDWVVVTVRIGRMCVEDRADRDLLVGKEPTSLSRRKSSVRK